MKENDVYSLCGLGGDTIVTLEDWRPESDEVDYIVTPLQDGVNGLKGKCVRPENCSLKDICSRKVIITEPKYTGFRKSVINLIYFPKNRALRLFGTDESDFS